MNEDNTTIVDNILKISNNYWSIILDYFTEHADSIITNVISNMIYGLITLLIVISFGYYLLKKFANKTIKVESQIYISGESSHIVCRTDNYLINQMPTVLHDYRKKLKTKNKNNEIFFWNTRVSTFILFTDGKRVLLYDREANQALEERENLKFDAHGAKAFHNNSLKCKLPKQFINSKIINMESIPGLVIESNTNLFLKLTKKSETAVMIGFIVYVSPNDLEKGIESSTVEGCKNKTVDQNDNKIIALNCLSVDDENLTAKAILGIKYLQLKKNFESPSIDKKCKIGIKPFVYKSTELISKQDDLKIIHGIGEKIEQMLNNIGIFKIEQIAEWNKENIKWVNEYLYFPNRIERENWVSQAREIVKKKNAI